MKKISLILLCSACFLGGNAQETKKNSLLPSHSATVQETRVNGSTEPIMPDGKPYSQWVAEEKTKRQKDANKIVASGDADVVVINAVTAKPQPVKVQASQQTGADKKEGQVVTVVTEQAIVGTTPVAPSTPSFTPSASVRNLASSPATAAVKPDDGNNLPAGTVNGSVVVAGTNSVQVEKAPSRTAAEIERAKQVEADKTKQPATNSMTGAVAPVAPAQAVEINQSKTNSTGGQPEKPVAAPAPKEKSEQAIEAPVKAKQGD